MVHYYNIGPLIKFLVLLEGFTAVVCITDDLVPLQLEEVLVDLMKKNLIVNYKDLNYLKAPWYYSELAFIKFNLIVNKSLLGFCYPKTLP